MLHQELRLSIWYKHGGISLKFYYLAKRDFAQPPPAKNSDLRFGMKYPLSFLKIFGELQNTTGKARQRRLLCASRTVESIKSSNFKTKPAVQTHVTFKIGSKLILFYFIDCPELALRVHLRLLLPYTK